MKAGEAREMSVADLRDRIQIEKDNLDFLNIPKDLSGIIDKIDATLFGLF